MRLNEIDDTYTPLNQLMNGSTVEDKSASWAQAINIDLSTIQFIHCHQGSTGSASSGQPETSSSDDKTDVKEG